MLANVGRITQAPAILDPQVAAPAPAQLLQRLLERRELGTAGGGTARERAEAPHLRALLRPRRERPRRRAAEQRDEVAALYLRSHSISSSARPVSGSGTVSPRALATLRLMTRVYLSARWIGKSPGFAPLRMRST